MNKFENRLVELMHEKDIDDKTLVEELGLSNTSVVFKWKNGYNRLLLSTAIKLADYFTCSIDYLLGRSETTNDLFIANYPMFGEQLKLILKEQNSSQYKLIKYAKISNKSLNNWLNNVGTPHIDSVIKIADYLNVTIDYLIGREN